VVTARPKPDQIKEAILDYGIKASFAKGWNTRGRPWSYGLRGHFKHHTAGVGNGVLAYILNTAGRYPFCNDYTRRDGSLIVVSALSAWHSGAGGPWSKLGIQKDLAHLYCWGSEIESRGLVKDITDEQFETQHKLSAAFRDLVGWGSFDRVINHKGWTNGVPELGISYKLPTYGRKIDTLYSADVWRNGAELAWKKHNSGAYLPVVDLSNVLDAIKSGTDNKGIERISLALQQVGYPRVETSGVWNDFIQSRYAAWQRKLGYTGSDADGIPGMSSLTALGEKSNLFTVRP